MERKKKRLFTAFAVASFAVFFAFALYFNAFGVNATLMMEFFSITEPQQGLIMTIQSIGGILISVFLALFGERYNKINTIIIGGAMMAVCSLMVGLVPSLFSPGTGYLFTLTVVFFAGIGYTVVDLMMNGVISDVYPQKKTTYIPFIHAFFGFGAMATPTLVALLVQPGDSGSFSVPFLLFGALAGVGTLLYAVVGKKLQPMTPYADMQQQRAQAVANPGEIFRDRRAWLILLIAFLYFAFLGGISSWLSTYCQTVLRVDYQTASLFQTLFFIGALVMRFTSPLFLKWLGTVKFFIIAALSAAACFFIVFFVKQPALMYALTPVGGFLQGGLVASIILLATDAFPTRSASASSLMVIATSAASLVTPLTMGAIARASGSFSLPMLLITACLALSGILVFCTMRKMTKDER